VSVSVQSFGELPRVRQEFGVLFELGEHPFHPVDLVEEFGVFGSERENLASDLLFFVFELGRSRIIENLTAVPAELRVVVVELVAPRTLDGFDVFLLGFVDLNS